MEIIVLPEGLESIEKYAFFNCENLKILTLPTTVKEIGEKAFDGCKSISENGADITLENQSSEWRKSMKANAILSKSKRQTNGNGKEAGIREK